MSSACLRCVFGMQRCLTSVLLLCRSQDKGFHVGKALLHVFSRSAPFTPVQIVQMEEVVEGETVHYNIPAELSDYVSRYWN